MKNYFFNLIFPLIHLSCKQVSPITESSLDSNSLPPFEKGGFASDSDHLDYFQCQDAGYIFNRLESPAKGRCTKIPVAQSYQCNAESIHHKFKSVGVDLPLIFINESYKLEEFADFDIDQCGEVNGFPIVILIRKEIEESSDLSFEVKSLCKKDSPACLK